MTTTDDRREAAARAAQGELARRHLGDFLALMLPEYERAPHTRLLCEHLEAIERREIDRLMLFLPPRHGKSLHSSQALPAWFLGRNPRRHVLLCSYADELAHKNSRIARGFVSSDRWPFDARLSPSSHAAGRWDTTENGGVVASGVGAGITGMGADLLVLDDLLRDRADADSPAVRESTWAWLTQVAMTRLHKGAAVVYATTRWHEDDPAARLLDGVGSSRWTVLRLPALAEENDPLGRDEGEALWPDEFGCEHFEEQRELMGPRAFQAVHQQDPTPERGVVFQSEWMNGRWSKLPDGLRIVQSVDSAFKTGVANDYSVVSTWGFDGRNYLLLDVWRDRVEYPQLVKAIQNAADEWNPERVLVEDKASGQSVVQTLKQETGLPVVPVPAEGSKISRAESVTGLFEAGRVLLPQNEPGWLEPWIREHLKFPRGAHDDQVDATSHALRHLRGRANQGAGGVAGVIVHALRPAREADPDRRREQRAREVAAARKEAEAEQPNGLPWGFPSD